MNNWTENWENDLAIQLLKKVGIESQDRILDFGCGKGTYSIPAARITNPKGQVFALDQNNSSLNKVQNKAEQASLNNLTIVKTTGSFYTEFDNDFFDVILLYDVLHFFDKKERASLFKELYRILKIQGLLSIFPKHTADNFPLIELSKTSVNELKQEIERAGFIEEKQVSSQIMHNSNLEKGTIYNFSKSRFGEQDIIASVRCDCNVNV
ncbi:MAG TPA: class I SAM-dependent methyltransferase [bacterium]|nr:class I SAM-dependent methyltransferase [bacterium]